MSSVWKNTNYLLDVPFIISKNIYEYDIRKANISVLFAEDIIDEKYYNYLKSIERMKRQVEIGYLIKNTGGLYDRLSQAIQKYRKMFMETNELADGDILSIKNDAIFTMKKVDNTVFANGIVEFIEKNRYSSFMKLDTVEIYFLSDQVSDTVSLDVKGMSDSNAALHHKYIATLIADTMYYMETGDINEALTNIQYYYNEYIEKRLDIGWYRNFNAASDYTVIANGAMYSLKHCSKTDIDKIHIGCNLNIMRILIRYLTNIYISRNR